MKKQLLLVLLLALSVAGHAKKKHHLELNLEQGQVYHHLSEARMQIVQEVMGQKMNIDIDMKGSTAYEVMEVVDGNYQMEAWYEAMEMDMSMKMGEMDLSAQMGDMEPLMDKILGSMTGIRFNVLMSTRGKVKEVSGMEEVMEAIFQELEDAPEAQITQIKQQMESSFGDKALVGSIQAVTAIFPEKPVQVGDSWEINTQVESGFVMDVSSTYTLEAMEKGHYVLSGSSELKSVESDEHQVINGMEMRYDLAGTSEASMTLGRENGWVLESSTSQKIKGHLKMKPNEQLPDGLDLPMSISTETAVSGK